MTHGSLFAGIGGFDLGFARADFKTVWQVEIDPFCRAVLETRFPKVQRFADICRCGSAELTPVDVITGGFPCQDLSVAGKRAGLAGKRSGLFHEFIRIVDALAPYWVVIENVCGLLSSPPGSNGEDFSLVLKKLTGFWPQVPRQGWRNAGICVGPKRSAAWRVLNSRYFGVAQHRRRVFIVSGPRTGSAAEVLFDSEGGAGDSAQSDASRKDIAGALAAGAGGSEFGRDGRDTLVCAPIRRWRGGDSDGKADYIDVRGQRENRRHGIGISQGGPGCTLGATDLHAIAFEPRFARNGRAAPESIGQPLKAQSARTGKADSAPLIALADARHPTPETLSSPPLDAHRVRDFAGLPEGLDGARYGALGNAVTVQIARWIAERIGKCRK